MKVENLLPKKCKLNWLKGAWKGNWYKSKILQDKNIERPWFL